MRAAIPFPDLSPEIFSVTIAGVEFALRWYALAYIVGIVIGWRLAVAALKRDDLWPGGRAPMRPEQAEAFLTWIIIGIILGGRLGFVLFYQPGYYLQNPGQILQIWQGGMAFHGGLAGVIVAGIAFCRVNRLPMLSVGDMLALVVPAGLLLGRIANFINAELWGRPTDLPWGVIFPGEAAQDCAGPVGLVERAFQTLCARHPSQLYEAALEGLILGAVLLWLAWRRGWLRAPGRIMGVFLAGYGLARFAVELVRQPDAQFIGPGNPLGHALSLTPSLGLTMGQLLSLPMIALGLYFIARARKASA